MDCKSFRKAISGGMVPVKFILARWRYPICLCNPLQHVPAHIYSWALVSYGSLGLLPGWYNGRIMWPPGLCWSCHWAILHEDWTWGTCDNTVDCHCRYQLVDCNYSMECWWWWWWKDGKVPDRIVAVNYWPLEGAALDQCTMSIEGHWGMDCWYRWDIGCSSWCLRPSYHPCRPPG